MQAVVFKGEGLWGLESLPVPKVQSDTDVLLRVEHASVCGTDIHILSIPPGHPARPGSVVGHEYVATVVEAGDGVRDLQVEDHVVVDANITCGLCLEVIRRCRGFARHRLAGPGRGNPR